MIPDARHLRTAARWPLGVVLTSWSYMWRTTPLHRREIAGQWPQDGPREVDAPVSMEAVQRPEDGAGPLFRRRYRGRITETSTSAAELMRRLQADPQEVAP